MMEFPGGPNPSFTGWPVTVFDGTNDADAVKALGIKPGDAIVTSPDGPILIKASQWDTIANASGSVA